MLNRYAENVGQADQVVMNNDKPKFTFSVSFPNEVLEKIVSYFDGRSLLKFKMLSNRCNGIVYNAVTYNRLWKKICLKEIPEKDMHLLLEKNFTTSIYLNFSENQYEEIFKQWLDWQASKFNAKFMCQKTFLSSNDIIKIICHKTKILVVFSSHTCVFSLLIADKIKQYYRENDPQKITENDPQKITENEYSVFPKAIVITNERQHYVRIKTNEQSSNSKVCPGFDNCPFNMINRGYNGANCRKPIHSELNTMTPDYNINICCWIKENCTSSNIIKHSCHNIDNDMFESTIYSSTVYGIVIDKMLDNCIQIHKMFKQLCFTIRPWLEDKYIEATAVHIHMDILFVGTQNGYLLAYRLQSWDDIINLKNKNLLLETQVNIGKIISMDVMDTASVKAIVVASSSGIVWIKIK